MTSSRRFPREAEVQGRSVSAPSDQALRRAADMFHEIGSALSSEDLITSTRSGVARDVLRGNLMRGRV